MTTNKTATGANATIRWNTNDEQVSIEQVYISFGVYNEKKGTDSYGVNDEDIFYYCKDEEELKSLMTFNPKHDFTVLKYEITK